jgi:hypothetical protein
MNVSETTVVTAITTLAELANHVRLCTLDFLNIANKSWLTWTPPGTSNHLLWHAGHALWVQDLLTVEQLTGQSELPDGWAAKFGSGSQPGQTMDWPAVDMVRAHLEAQLERVQGLLIVHRELIAREANRVSRKTGWQLLAGMIHGWHDEARHQGEMHLLVKMQSAQR